MAWRIDEAVIKGEIDFQTRDKVTGKIWFKSLAAPVELILEGCPWQDLAGHVLRFTNPNPEEKDLKELRQHQIGVAGDITASRKVKVPDVPMKEFLELLRQKKKWTWHWGNSLYLEWFSESNGRVVIESSAYALDIDHVGTWIMTDDDAKQQQEKNSQAMVNFMQQVGEAVSTSQQNLSVEYNDDEAQSVAEAEADKETAHMDQLLDRISARLDREGLNHAENFDRVMQEERERLRKERGKPEPKPPTPEQEAEQSRWIEEMNRISQDAVEDGIFEEPEPHPLVESTFELGIRLSHEIKDRGWIPENAPAEHPLYEVQHGVQSASAKLAGALGDFDEDAWPPDPLFAGDTLVRLKKARNYLRDALVALDSADEERLADSEWRGKTRHEITPLLAAVQQLIDELRNALGDA